MEIVWGWRRFDNTCMLCCLSPVLGDLRPAFSWDCSCCDWDCCCCWRRICRATWKACQRGRYNKGLKACQRNATGRTKTLATDMIPFLNDLLDLEKYMNIHTPFYIHFLHLITLHQQVISRSQADNSTTELQPQWHGFPTLIKTINFKLLYWCFSW